MNQNQRYECYKAFTGYEVRMDFTGYECRVAFQINGIHAVWHEPGACTLQNLAY